MPVELITTTTADGIELDGALYRPPGDRAVLGSVLMVHGLTWNFYRGPSRWLPPLLADAGYVTLSLNMRDHDLAEPKDFELSHHDLRAGVEWLRAREPGEPVIVAHGYACNKVACYPAWSGDQRVGACVLTTLGAVKAYRPDIWDTVLRQAARLPSRVLVVQGAIDPLIDARSRAEELERAASATRVDVHLLPGANHYFDGCHRELAAAIVGWLGPGQG
jgi:alpha-beta hydrolase superfamily lysophospholipase